MAYQNVYPLGCSPMSRASNAQAGGDCVETLLALARQHNAVLSVALKKLEKKLPGFKYSIFDAYNSVLDKINNPSKYGFKEGKVACCGSGAYRGSDTCAGGLNGTQKFQLCSNPSEYVWFDYAHTTERANRQLAAISRINLEWTTEYHRALHCETVI